MRLKSDKPSIFRKNLDMQRTNDFLHIYYNQELMNIQCLEGTNLL